MTLGGGIGDQKKGRSPSVLADLAFTARRQVERMAQRPAGRARFHSFPSDCRQQSGKRGASPT